MIIDTGAIWNSRGELYGRKVFYSSFFEDDEILYDVAKLYCRTFIGNEHTKLELEAAKRNIQKHTKYEGFVGLVATDPNGKLLGFSYGYKSLPGQFYRGKLEQQLNSKEIGIWLNDCYEFVELAVDPLHKRMGVGSSLHNKMLDKVPNATSVLTTDIHNQPAINLYKRYGWKIIKENAPVISSDNPQVILGIDIEKERSNG